MAKKPPLPALNILVDRQEKAAWAQATLMHKQPLHILVDRREKMPWSWEKQRATKSHILTFKKVTIRTGDYTLRGQEKKFCIERKGCSDLAQSCTTGHARFRREHERMTKIVAGGGFAIVIIEDSLASVLRYADSRRKGDAARILGTLGTWTLTYHVPWIFAGDRPTAQRIALDLMTKWQEQQNAKRTRQ